MARLKAVNLDRPDSQRSLSRGIGSLVRVGPLAIGRAVLEPGWRWSVDVKPVVGTTWCEAHHLHVLLGGRFGVVMSDGETAEFGPGDVFEIPPGHDAWVIGDERATLLDVSGNVAEFGLPTSAPRVVMTLLMTDIVNSTPTAVAMGDGPWRQLLERHNRVVRNELVRFRGREIDTTGDGFLAAFDSAAAALQAAAAICASVRELGVEVRVGVHTGEVETSGDNVAGVAVHATARIMSLAGASEILVSAVTRVIATGAGFTFEDRGERQLKGIAEPMHVFALVR